MIIKWYMLFDYWNFFKKINKLLLILLIKTSNILFKKKIKIYFDIFNIALL